VVLESVLEHLQPQWGQVLICSSDRNALISGSAVLDSMLIEDIRGILVGFLRISQSFVDLKNLRSYIGVEIVAMSGTGSTESTHRPGSLDDQAVAK